MIIIIFFILLLIGAGDLVMLGLSPPRSKPPGRDSGAGE